MVNYILIPSFIASSLARNKLPLSNILNFDKIRETLSINDIAVLAGLQNCWDVVGGKKNLYNGGYELSNEWFKTASGENKSFYTNVLNGVLVESGQANNEVNDRLFNKENVDQSENKTYELIDIGPKYYGIIINPGVFPDSELSKQLVRDVLRSMYLYCSQHEVAQTRFFEEYMKDL